MKKQFILCFTLLLVSLKVSNGGEPVLPKQLTLKESYQLAVKNSERLLITQEDFQQAQERRKQALGAVLPNVRWLLTSVVQDTSGTGRDGSGVSGTLTRKERTDSKFQVKQPLFQGFKESSAYSGYRAEARKAEAELMRDSVLLFLDVATSFYQVKQLELLNENLNVSMTLTQERIKELQERVRLGKSRGSEVLISESQLAALKSQVAGNAGRLVSARHRLGYYLGADVRSIQLVDDLAFPSPVEDENKILQLGNNRSDIRALREEVQAKQAGLKVAKAGFYPAANLLGNYYTHRPGFQSEIDWDISFNLDVPIFQGGGVKALTREASSRVKQAELALAQRLRLAEVEISEATASLNSSVNETAALADAYEKAKRSYESQVKEYRYGLVNNLEVLQVMNSMQEIKAKYDTALLQTKLDSLKLKAVTEELP